MRLFVTAARPEHASVLQEPRYQCEQIACLTGLARFDRLYNDPKKIITVMPTWRKYLAKPQSTVQDEHALVDDFTSSDFFRTYNALLNHPRLLAAAKRTGYSVRFMPHPLLRSAMPLFQRNEQVDFYPYDARYRDIFAESDLIITDYSSAVVDFAYLRKPVVYFHFDREEFTSGKHIYIPGYFDYETMGFGEVTYDLETLVDCIIGYMENHCSMKPEYVQRADAFFAFNDKNNCRPVFHTGFHLITWGSVIIVTITRIFQYTPLFNQFLKGWNGHIIIINAFLFTFPHFTGSGGNRKLNILMQLHQALHNSVLTTSGRTDNGNKFSLMDMHGGMI